MNRERRKGRRRRTLPKQTPSDNCAGDNRADLPGRRRHRQRQDRRAHRNRRALPVGTEASRHSPDRLGDHRDRDDLEPVQPSGAGKVAELRHAVAEQRQRHGGWHRKSQPCRQSPRQARAHDSQGDADLAARRPGQKLAQRDDVGVGRLFEPFAACDELATKIAKMRDRPAEACQTKLGEDAQDFERRTRMTAFHGHFTNRTHPPLPFPADHPW
jgi:hypothetical protein